MRHAEREEGGGALKSQLARQLVREELPREETWRHDNVRSDGGKGRESATCESSEPLTTKASRLPPTRDRITYLRHTYHTHTTYATHTHTRHTRHTHTRHTRHTNTRLDGKTHLQGHDIQTSIPPTVIHTSHMHTRTKVTNRRWMGRMRQRVYMVVEDGCGGWSIFGCSMRMEHLWMLHPLISINVASLLARKEGRGKKDEEGHTSVLLCLQGKKDACVCTLVNAQGRRARKPARRGARKGAKDGEG